MKTLQWWKPRDSSMPDPSSVGMNGRLWCKKEVEFIDEKHKSRCRTSASSVQCRSRERYESAMLWRQSGRQSRPAHSTSAGPGADEWSDHTFACDRQDAPPHSARTKTVNQLTRNTSQSPADRSHHEHVREDTHSTAVSVERLARYTDCRSDNSLHRWTCSMSWRAMRCSSNFGKLQIGQYDLASAGPKLAFFITT